MGEAMEAIEPEPGEQTLTQKKQEIAYEWYFSHAGSLFRAHGSHLFEALTGILEAPSWAFDGRLLCTESDLAFLRPQRQGLLSWRSVRRLLRRWHGFHLPH